MTAEELLRLPRGQYRYELINGELKTMSPSSHDHGRITVRFTAPLAQFVWDNKLGEVYGAETGFLLTTAPDTVLAPDASYISAKHIEEKGHSTGYWPGAPDLAVEVLSPSERRTQIENKIAKWLSFGTIQVWVVNPKNETVIVYRSTTDTMTVRMDDTVEADDLLPGFRIAVKWLFD
jgi:Uma2 family endonuclease